MRILITNYRNIRQLGVDIEEGKVNYLFGVCGSGKSSILDAISKPLEARDTTVGVDSTETSVQVDGAPPVSGVATVYSIERQNILFSQAANKDCYRVFVGDESELKTHEASFHASIESLRGIRSRLSELIDRVDRLAREIGKPPKSGRYTAASKICKAHKALSSATGGARRTVAASDYAYLEWRYNGFTINEAFENGRCPFCDQPISDDLSLRLSEIRDLTLKDLKPIFTSTTLMDELGFKEPDYFDESAFNELKGRLERLFRARTQISIVLQYCNIGNGTVLLEGVPQGLKLEEDVYEFVPELRQLVDDVNNRREELSRLMGQMRADLKKMIGTNARSLNSKLRMLGIPYEFEIENADREGRKAAYTLRHIRSDHPEDMRECLSYGEKNLIALLLFLHNNEAELTLIDDPASSYDEFRRSQIYRCIMEHQGKTVLVVSHDQAFVRRAVCDRDSDQLGAILFLENAGRGCVTFPLVRSSFVFIDDEIKARIKASDNYYQKMVNVRLFCDIHRHEVSESVWGYTSAVLHGAARDEIVALLEERSVTEQSIVDELSELVGCLICTMPDSVDMTVKDSFTDYEALIVAREVLEARRIGGHLTDEGALQLNMLNDLVHMNDCALFCLNPYEFAVWPPVFSALLEEVRNE